MISKEEFIDYINFIKERREKEEKFINALENLSEDTYCDCYLYNEYEDKLVKLLEITLEDFSHEISYFLYDCNYLNKFDKKRCPKINNKYLYTSVETLYDYLIGENKHD